MLSSVREEFGSQWKHIGYTLGLEHNVLENIESNFAKVEERAFKMLSEWMRRDVQSCYCKLISAMNEGNLVSGVEILKKKITKSK